MEYKDIMELATLMKETGLTKLRYKGDKITIRMERAAGVVTAVGAPVAAPPQQKDERKEEQAAPGAFTVRSPMVGVLYTAPGADKEPYVSVGDKVHAGDVLCIVEAMKIMNEIAAERDGVITEVCADNKQVVEYGQPLFRMDTTRV